MRMIVEKIHIPPARIETLMRTLFHPCMSNSEGISAKYRLQRPIYEELRRLTSSDKLIKATRTAARLPSILTTQVSDFSQL